MGITISSANEQLPVITHPLTPRYNGYCLLQLNSTRRCVINACLWVTEVQCLMDSAHLDAIRIRNSEEVLA